MSPLIRPVEWVPIHLYLKKVSLCGGHKVLIEVNCYNLLIVCHAQVLHFRPASEATPTTSILLSLSYYKSEISEVWKSPKCFQKISKTAKAKARNFKIEWHWVKLSFTTIKYRKRPVWWYLLRTNTLAYFTQSVMGNESKMFYNIDTRCQCYKTFFLLCWQLGQIS